MLHWTQDDDKLISNTEFGAYEIKVSKTRRTDPVDVVLGAFKSGVEFRGAYLTIGMAMDAATADYAYRQNMWETL